MTKTDLIQSTDSLSLESLPYSRKCSLDSLSSFCPRNNSLNSSYSSSSFSTSSISSFSSSYTSCTRPLAGQKVSDSHVPNSSILDTGPDDLHIGSRRSKKSRMSSKKDSFDDTSKDISDIEDWDNEESDETSFDNEDIRKKIFTKQNL